MIINSILRKRFENQEDFESYASPLLRSVNPEAHHLTLMTQMVRGDELVTSVLKILSTI